MLVETAARTELKRARRLRRRQAVTRAHDDDDDDDADHGDDNDAAMIEPQTAKRQCARACSRAEYML